MQALETPNVIPLLRTASEPGITLLGKNSFCDVVITNYQICSKKYANHFYSLSILLSIMLPDGRLLLSLYITIQIRTLRLNKPQMSERSDVLIKITHK